MAASQKLPPMYVKLAKTQLGEDPKNVDAHVEAFRRWLSSMPHLTCPDDESFLLMFLRQSKYVHAKAQARLDNFCTLSARKCLGDFIWATPIDLKSERLEYYLNLGMYIPLGYMENGRLGIWLRPGVWNPDQLPLAELFYFTYKVMFMVYSDPRAVIAGAVIMMDFTGGTPKQVVKDPNDIRTTIRFVQEAMPVRTPHMMICNEGKFVETMLNIFMFYMKDKMKRRLVRCGPDMEKAYEAEPGMRKLLPPVLGGEGKTVEELIRSRLQYSYECLFYTPLEANKKRFHEFYAKGDLTATIRVDEAKRPSSARDFLREYKDYNANVMGTSGTYVKKEDEI